MVEEKENADNVLSFKQKQMKQWASEFVDIFEKDGHAAAVEYARKNIGQDNYDQLRPQLQQEFTERGYFINAKREQ